MNRFRNMTLILALLLVTLLEGLQAIAAGYPRNVRIFFEERR